MIKNDEEWIFRQLRKLVSKIQGSSQWDEERWEEYKHDRLELINELGDKYYELYEHDSEEENEEEVLRRMEWKEEEEKNKKRSTSE